MAVAVEKKTPAGIRSPKRGTSAHSRWSRAEYRMLLAQLKSHLADGRPDLDIAKEMGLDTQTYNLLKREMYAQEKVDLHGKTTEEVFIDYMNRQEGCIHDLNRLIQGRDDKIKVGAIRAKSDILDKVIARGQEFGIIDKVPEKKQIVAGVMVAELSNDSLRSLVLSEIGGLKKFVDRYGDQNILGQPMIDSKSVIDGEAKEMEAEEELPPPTFSADKRPKTALGGLKKTAGAHASHVARRKVTSPLPGGGVNRGE